MWKYNIMYGTLRKRTQGFNQLGTSKEIGKKIGEKRRARGSSRIDYVHNCGWRFFNGRLGEIFAVITNLYNILVYPPSLPLFFFIFYQETKDCVFFFFFSYVSLIILNLKPLNHSERNYEIVSEQFWFLCFQSINFKIRKNHWNPVKKQRKFFYDFFFGDIFVLFDLMRYHVLDIFHFYYWFLYNDLLMRKVSELKKNALNFNSLFHTHNFLCKID